MRPAVGRGASAEPSSALSRKVGALVVSLDFELYWGVRDHRTLDQYRANLEGVRRAVPAMLDMFAQYGVQATWATVGFVFFDNREQLLSALPERKPVYSDSRLSPYPELERIGTDESSDPFHYGASLLRLIAAHPGQEIGTHTFSHYCCLEPGQDVAAFREDLAAARRAAARCHLRMESLVFPRNQYSRPYLEICREMGIRAYRGNEASWLYRSSRGDEHTLGRRFVRKLEAYLPLSAHTCASFEQVALESPCNIPSSRFLRPYSPLLAWLESLRLRRIVSGMTHAARNGLIYHLWWHPENFGTHTDKNLAFLERVLRAYARLRAEYGMESLNMGQVAARVGEAAVRSG